MGIRMANEERLWYDLAARTAIAIPCVQEFDARNRLALSPQERHRLVGLCATGYDVQCEETDSRAEEQPGMRNNQLNNITKAVKGDTPS